MRRNVWLILAAILVFAVVLIARLPARWVATMLPAAILCEQANGSIWQGSCARVLVQQQPIGRAAWTVHPMALLRGAVAVDVEIDGDGLQLRTGATLGRGEQVELTALHLQATLPSRLIARLPPDLSGRLQAELPRVVMVAGWLRELTGRIEVQQLFSGGPQPAPLGNFELQFPENQPAGKLVGRLRDKGGPLDVQGTLTLGATPGYLLEGTVLARDSANEVLRKQLELLGAPDASGRRRFAQEAAL